MLVPSCNEIPVPQPLSEEVFDNSDSNDVRKKDNENYLYFDETSGFPYYSTQNEPNDLIRDLRLNKSSG